MAARPTYPSTSHLRNACDACTAAKVKCSQGRPQCKRCEYRGFLCQYSVSLRATKNARRPNSVSSSVPSAFDSTATSSNHDSHETLDDVSMASPSAQSTQRVFSHAYNQITPSFDDESLLPSYFDDWDPDATNPSLQIGFPESNEDTAPFFPNFINLPNQNSSNNNNKRSHSNNLVAKAASSFHAVPPPSLPLSTPALTPPTSASDSISLPQTCQCQQLILSKLSEISHRQANHTVPFDQCLSENKSVISLCNTTVNCSNTHHEDDLVLMLTHLALITHVILFYDRPLGSQYEPADDSSGEDGQAIQTSGAIVHHSQHSDRKKQQLQRPSSKPQPQSHLHRRAQSKLDPSHERQQQQQQQQQQRQQPILPRVRLSLGTYELDSRDEQILQNNLLRIELSKIKSLMEAFERRFCTLEWMSGGATGMGGEHNNRLGGMSKHGDGEEKPLGEIMTWLKRRLRGNYEALAHWGGVGL